MNESIKRDLARTLARLAEREPWLVARPVPGVQPGNAAEFSAKTSVDDSDSVTVNSRQANASDADDSQEKTVPNLHEQANRAERDQRMNKTRENTTTKWERGAPEPVYDDLAMGTIEDHFPEYTDLVSFNEAIQSCQKCPLGGTRNKFVFGVGDPKADLVLVGEAPGADEDRTGEPFVGRAGQLLDKILAAVELKRGEGVYICNILKCRPPGNRDPQPSEVHECEPHLVKQLQLIRPKLIVALGRVAAQTLLRTSDSLSKLRGKVHDYHGIPLLVTFHPAALLRNPGWKRPTWEDVQEMKRMLDEEKEV